MIYSVPLTFQNNFGQWVIALFSLIFSVLFGLFFAWFRYFQVSNYRLTPKLYISLGIIEGVSIALGFVFYGLLNVRVHLIWTSFAILPAVVGTFLLFLGNWISNDYFIYEQKKGNGVKSVVPAQSGTDSNAPKGPESANGRLQEIG